jgi:hypothetical protein
MRTQKVVSILTVCLALTACGSSEEPLVEEPIVSTAEVLPNLPLPPGGMILGTEGTGEALQLLISTPIGSDTVVAFYRSVLSRPPYILMNDNTQEGLTSFYVEQDGPPLWVTVQHLEAGGSLVRLTGVSVQQNEQEAQSGGEDGTAPSS